MTSNHQGHPEKSLKAERVQRSGTPIGRNRLKAERVQRSGTPTDRGGLKGERVRIRRDWAVRLRRLPGWRIDEAHNLEKVFVAADLENAVHFAASIREFTGSVQGPPGVRRRDRTVRITILTPPGGPTSVEFSLAGLVDERWPEQ